MNKLLFKPSIEITILHRDTDTKQQQKTAQTTTVIINNGSRERDRDGETETKGGGGGGLRGVHLPCMHIPVNIRDATGYLLLLFDLPVTCLSESSAVSTAKKYG